MDECRRAWAEAGVSYTYPELLAEAQSAPSLVSLIDPDDPRLATPGDLPGRIREICAESGQSQPLSPGAVIRCTLESIALKHGYVISLIAEATGDKPFDIHIVGGGAEECGSLHADRQRLRGECSRRA